MIGISEAQWMAWLSPIIWPFLRTLAVFGSAPIFSSRAIPARVKVGLALLVAVSAQASLSQQPIVGLNDALALETAAQQVGVGLALGFAVRLVFSTVELVGELVGLQMGLNFASFFDPTSNAQSSAVANFFGQIASLLFIAMNGHLMVLLAVISSFEAFPVGASLLDMLRHLPIQTLGAQMFASALWMALPMTGALLLVNLALGIVSRVAPQMNIYAVGFPVTLIVGLLGVTVTLPMLDQPMTALLEHALTLFMAH